MIAKLYSIRVQVLNHKDNFESSTYVEFKPVFRDQA